LKAEEIRLEEVKRVGGACQEAAAAKYSDDDNGQRFVKPSHSSFVFTYDFEIIF